MHLPVFALVLLPARIHEGLAQPIQAGQLVVHGRHLGNNLLAEEASVRDRVEREAFREEGSPVGVGVHPIVRVSDGFEDHRLSRNGQLVGIWKASR